MISRKNLKTIITLEIFILGLVLLAGVRLILTPSRIVLIPTASPVHSPTTTQIVAPFPSAISTIVETTPSQSVILSSPTAEASVTPSPTATQFMIIGKSVLGSPLTVHQFGNGPAHRMIVAGIHGGYEWNTVQLAEKLIEYLRADPSAVPPEVTLYILPSINPDGYNKEFGAKGRANANGVDINRNFAAFWKADWDRKGCWNMEPITAGAAPDSEPETRALESFLLEYRIDAFISYHSAALGIFPGGQPADADSVHLAEALHKVSGYPYPPLEYGCKYTGQLIDWASAHEIAAVDIELTTHSELDYEINLKVLERFLNWTR
jgi:predicted deacylase